MNVSKGTARIVGILFLIAMVSSILGGGIIESALNVPDYLANLPANQTQVITGVLLELLNATAVVGIAVLMFPIFRKRQEALALWYVGFRMIEAIMQIVSDVVPLSLLGLSQGYPTAGAGEAAAFQAAGTVWIAARTVLVGTMLGIFFSLGALVFYTLLYQSRLMPRWFSAWGLIGAVLILIWNLLEMLGISISAGMIFALPIILNEILLGIWLIVKGFNSSAVLTGPA